MFLGWYDPDRKKPARQKVLEGIERYVEKFGAEPELVLTSELDAAELLSPAKKTQLPAPALPVRTVAYIPRWTFYIGSEDARDQPAAA
ncbi:MAG: hypothetical protein H0V24_03380 [Chloroflexia bacterium]|nr:hypothetical protein [Chloroflexia bacterium]MDQ3412992.1 hypothetical protein [Chloroflexota bacterium]